MILRDGTVMRGPLALLILAACTAQSASTTGEKLLVYRLRGEVRPFLFWLGRDDVGGGRVTILQTYSSPARWREEIEVLFGSEPERIPGRINRWGHGRESADWIWDAATAAPRLLGTEFEGVMRHSTESSIDEVVPETGAAHPYDVTRSVVYPERAYHELRVFTDKEQFHYRRPDHLLAKYRECLASTPPLRQRDLPNRPPAYGEPYGFLTGLSRILGQIVEAHERSPEALRRTKPSLVFVFNTKPYLLDVTGIRRVASFQTRYGALRLRDVAVVEFRCFNTVKRTRTDFAVWVPLGGDLKGLPVRIMLQPRWWLRLQLDLDPDASRVLPGQALRTARIGSDLP